MSRWRPSTCSQSLQNAKSKLGAVSFDDALLAGMFILAGGYTSECGD